MGEPFNRNNQFQVAPDHWKNVSRAGLRRAIRHTPLLGFPVEHPFTRNEDIDAYLTGNKIQCLLCGRMFKNVGIHAKQLHLMPADEYKIKYGIPLTRGLCCQKTSENYSTAVKRSLENPGRMDQLLETARRARQKMAQVKPTHRSFSEATKKSMCERVNSYVYACCKSCGIVGEEKKAPWLCKECRKKTSPERRREISKKHYYKDLEHSRRLLRERAIRVRAKKKFTQVNPETALPKPPLPARKS